jgi:AcrR family transcriptional regulator
MMPRATGPGRAPTRERILDQAERLIAARGVYGFTLRDIAAPLRMRAPAIYKHYKSRDDVLVGVSRRFIALLAAQFEFQSDLSPPEALRAALNAFVRMLMDHPAYVRLALVDFATPGGGMEYVKLAAGGSFRENFTGGPLASMHARLRAFLRAGVRSGEFRRVDATDLYRFLKATLLIRLVFPDDALLLRRPSAREISSVQRWLWDIAKRHLAANPACIASERPPGTV